MNDTSPLRLTNLNRQAQPVRAGYRGSMDDNLFFGFKLAGADNSSLFLTLGDLKHRFKVRNLGQLEEAAKVAGQEVKIEFWNCEGKYTWEAYLWNGAFRVGTSADRLKLEVAQVA